MKNNQGIYKQNRRDFLSAIVRGIIASGLALSGGYLLLKKEPEEACAFEFTCTLCGNSAHCTLPAARSYQEYQQQQGMNQQNE